ncbi:hypothetical protein Rhopal_003646-T1 [Rhodotorula paludigena]|uniref:Uncharacterized protein n=1 Tax=Rhodotorula paludigena TaxID=86838 RepID=A0AAV5GN12_9BASI|nr:hypothetical protein Rhopal_003646-T1 [Rhodotorula paludigena]
MAILQRPFSEGEPVRRLEASCAADCPAPAEYDPTVEDAYTLTSTVDGIEYAIELVDTAGQEEYRFALDATAREADGFILAYSIDSPDSFELLPDFLHSLRKATSPHENPSPALTPENTPFPFLVVGNKCDKPPADRVVTAQQGLTFARTGGGLFFECSAKSRVNIDSAFLALVRTVARSKSLHGEHVRLLKGRDDGLFNGNVGFIESGGRGQGGRIGPNPTKSLAGGGVRYGQNEKEAAPGMPRRPTRDPSLAMDRRRSLSVGGLGRDPSELHDEKKSGCGCVIC